MYTDVCIVVIFQPYTGHSSCCGVHDSVRGGGFFIDDKKVFSKYRRRLSKTLPSLPLPILAPLSL